MNNLRADQANGNYYAVKKCNKFAAPKHGSKFTTHNNKKFNIFNNDNLNYRTAIWS